MSQPRSAVVLFASILSCMVALRAPAQTPAPTTAPPADLQEDLRHARSLSRVFHRAAEVIGPSVVHITQINEVRFQRGWFSPIESKQMPTGAGSGVIVSRDGYILTNNHVIENAERVDVTLNDGRTFQGKIIGADPATDLGVVKIEAGDAPLTAAQFGDSDDLVVGDWVIAVGSAFGIFDNTVTAGIVSAKGRTNLTGPSDSYQDFIQTDAAVNPGNSGGPLVNLEGKVVGINSQIASRSGGYEGLSFAIPAAIAQPVMEMLVKTGHVSRGWVGITMGSPVAGTAGVPVSAVSPGGPAALAGIKPGDVITRYGGRAIDSLNRLRTAIATTPPNTDVEVEVSRGGKKVAVMVRTADSLDSAARAPGGGAIRTYGFTVVEIPRRNARLNRISGVVVDSVDSSGPAAQAQLNLEDIIAEVNGTPVPSVDEFDRVMKDSSGRIRLNIIRLKTGERGYLDILPRR